MIFTKTFWFFDWLVYILNQLPLSRCCDPDATTWKLDGSPKDPHAKPLCEPTPNKRCFFHQSNQAQKPVKHSYSQNIPFDTMKTRHRFCPHGGVKRVYWFFWHRHQLKTIRSWSGSGVMGAVTGMSGRRDAKDVEVEGTKTMNRRNKKGSPTTLITEPHHILFLNKEGSAICDRFPKLFS